MGGLIQDRAYRVTKPFNIKGPSPTVDSVLYVESSRSGSAKLVFSSPAGHLFRLRLNESEIVNKLTLAKFVTLPPALRAKFHINDEGQRLHFRKGSIFAVTGDNMTVANGTRMLCIEGGKQPLMSYVNSAGKALHWEPKDSELVKLARADGVYDSTHSVVVDTHWMKNAFPGHRPVFSATLRHEGHELNVSRKSDNQTDILVIEGTPGAKNGIGCIIRENLGTATASKNCTFNELIEAFVQFKTFEYGVCSFEKAVDRLVSSNREDNRLITEQATRRQKEKEQAPESNTTGTVLAAQNRKRGAYWKLIQQQYRL
ncbi:hypothetical protein [Marinobacter sp.]|uniref:hypothetical protein n=1 Tax=Marinobacter sp. TaxID=50741 RepID=UPI003A95D520